MLWTLALQPARPAMRTTVRHTGLANGGKAKPSTKLVSPVSFPTLCHKRITTGLVFPCPKAEDGEWRYSALLWAAKGSHLTILCLLTLSPPCPELEWRTLQSLPEPQDSWGCGGHRATHSPSKLPTAGRVKKNSPPQ